MHLLSTAICTSHCYCAAVKLCIICWKQPVRAPSPLDADAEVAVSLPQDCESTLLTLAHACSQVAWSNLGGRWCRPSCSDSSWTRHTACTRPTPALRSRPRSLHSSTASPSLTRGSTSANRPRAFSTTHARRTVPWSAPQRGTWPLICR